MAGLRRRATLRRRLRDGRRKCGLDDDGRNSSTLGRSPLSSIITTYAGGLSPRRQLRLDEQQLYDLGNRPSPPLRPPPARHSASTPSEERWSALFCAGIQPAASLHPLRTGVPWGREGRPLAQPTRFIMLTSAKTRSVATTIPIIRPPTLSSPSRLPQHQLAATLAVLLPSSRREYHQRPPRGSVRPPSSSSVPTSRLPSGSYQGAHARWPSRTSA